MYDINGKAAIVTGGANGLGKATVEAILAKGGLPVIADWNEELGKKTAEEFGVPFFKVDVSQEEQVKNLVEETVKLYGHLDIMVNNAGIADGKLLHETTTEEYRHVLGVNQDGVYFGCKYAVQQLLKQGTPGAIVNVSSMNGLIAAPRAPFYTLSKTSLRGLTKAMALTYARQGIRVNSIHPGNVASGLVCKEYLGEETIKMMEQAVPIGRIGEAAEIAHAIIFMIENTFLVGSEIVVDGGYVIQ